MRWSSPRSFTPRCDSNLFPDTNTVGRPHALPLGAGRVRFRQAMSTWASTSTNCTSGGDAKWAGKPANGSIISLFAASNGCSLSNTANDLRLSVGFPRPNKSKEDPLDTKRLPEVLNRSVS